MHKPCRGGKYLWKIWDEFGNGFRTLRHEIRGKTGIIILPIYCPSRDNFRHTILVKLCRRHYISVEMIRIYLFMPLGTNDYSFCVKLIKYYL